MAEEDVISSLPECLLLEIISRLPTTKHAIRTSTLSKRWQHLWTLLPNLIFVESKDNGSYIWCIDKILNQCPTHAKLNKFELRLNTTSQLFGINCYKSSINWWIRYAITRNVQEVNIELQDGGNLGKFRYDDDYFFMNLCATQMKLTCVFIKPIGAISWKNLKCLCISDGILDEDVIADILSGSPCLETLELDNSYGFSLINVTSKSVKNLVFSNYDYSTYCKQDDVIKINAPYILSLTIRCTMDLPEILFLNVSSLIKADLVYWPSVSLFGLDEEQQEELLKGLLHCLGHVKTITLGESTTEVLSRLVAKGFQFFEEANDID